MKKQLKLLPLALILSLLIGLVPLAVLAAGADATAENIFEGKSFYPGNRATATHSGSYNNEPVNYDYTKLTDGDMHLHTGRFSTKSSDSSQVFDGIIDLKGVYKLTELQIYDFNPSTTASGFMGTALEIEVLLNGEWISAVSCATNEEILAHRVGSKYLSFDLSAFSAEQIRIYIPARLGSNSISMYEIKCFGTLESIVDVFEGKVFEAGEKATPFFVGTHGGVNVNYDYTKLTDNNTHYQTGRFSTVSAHTSQVFDAVMDLGGSYYLNELKINDFNSTATTAPFMGTGLEIQVCSYGIWTTVVKCESNEEIVAHRLDNVYLSFNLGGARADKVRIYIPGRLGTNSISINEIECSAIVDNERGEFYDNLLLNKPFVPTEAAASEVHPDASCDYGYTVITDGSYAPKGGRFSTKAYSDTQHVDAYVNLDGLYDLGELRIYDFNAHAEPNRSNPGYLGTSLTVEAFNGGVWTTVISLTQEEYASHRVAPSDAWGAQYLAFDLRGVHAEMLRIYIPENISPNTLSFYEITCAGYKLADHSVHSGADAVVENNVPADCDSTGSYDKVVYCYVCGAEMSRETVTVPALGHTPGETVIENSVETGCTSDGGYDKVVYCTTCNAELSRETVTVSAIGHVVDEAVIENNVDPDCDSEGSYDEVYYCTVCKNEVGRETKTVPALGHIEVKDEGYDATCTTAGLTEGKHCSVCDAVLVEQVSYGPLGHDPKEQVVENNVAPDCTNSGSYDNVVYCAVCNEELSRETVTVDPIGHTFTDYAYNNDKTCTAHGTKTATCDNGCGETNTINDENNPATGHVDGAWETVTAPSCTAEGKQITKCTVCGETTKEGTIPTVAHTKSDWIIDVPATCLTNGAKHTECTVCGTKLDNQSIPSLGHSFTNYVYDEGSQSCTTDGTKTADCDNGCGTTDTVIDTEHPALGHTYTTVVTAPTCTTEGYTTYTCTACGDTYVADEVSALGHDFADATTEAPKTCKVCGETEGEKLPTPTPDTDPTPEPMPEKNHDECKAPSIFEEILNLILNFIRTLFGMPEKCICGEDL